MQFRETNFFHHFSEAETENEVNPDNRGQGGAGGGGAGGDERRY